MFDINKNNRSVYLSLLFCFFILQSSFSKPQPPPPNKSPTTPGGQNDVQDVQLPIDEWQEVLIIPAVVMGMFFIYKKSARFEPEK